MADDSPAADARSVPITSPILLAKQHDVSQFDCGKFPLNEFLKKYALQNQASGSSRTYVSMRGGHVIGYYSLAPFSIDYDDATERSRKGQSRNPVPAILMTRYAVTVSEQGKGLGRSLFRDALRRAYNGAEVIGGRIFLVHAKDEEAAALYEKWDMERLPKNSLHLCLLFKDIKASLGI